MAHNRLGCELTTISSVILQFTLNENTAFFKIFIGLNLCILHANTAHIYMTQLCTYINTISIPVSFLFIASSKSLQNSSRPLIAISQQPRLKKYWKKETCNITMQHEIGTQVCFATIRENRRIDLYISHQQCLVVLHQSTQSTFLSAISQVV